MWCTCNACPCAYGRVFHLVPLTPRQRSPLIIRMEGFRLGFKESSKKVFEKKFKKLRKCDSTYL